MRYVLAAAAMMAMLAGPAYSQMKMGGGEKDPLQSMYERQDKEKADIERDYNTTMKRLKAQNAVTTTNSDPWRGVRQGGETSAKR
jgi:hypothetical protein